MNKQVGYARVSSHAQDLQLQIDALRKAGCAEEHIFIDKVSGARTERPGLNASLELLQPGDTLTVWRLDRLGRSMPHLVALVEGLLKRKIGFRSLCDGSIDTTTASGELMFNIFSSLAQFERRLIQERTKAGLAAARARGRKGGRKQTISDDPRVKTAKRMHKDHGMSIAHICQILKISRATFYRYIALPEEKSAA
ncbi:recombinase family protein [Ktedonosporobacter rubrisoli]|uniref:Recombinase family protein n=1 Tax=Ktedonosporobacter rubrisoli TaxID=2509675 RepID=A0A4P6JJP6_KTERU|nr:recombinase family protein [Ktedonosporobacter rubrisoli]QBD75160.1 recombinase family protein [Ktedonosporobacter rubrisoli]